MRALPHDGRARSIACSSTPTCCSPSARSSAISTGGRSTSRSHRSDASSASTSTPPSSTPTRPRPSGSSATPLPSSTPCRRQGFPRRAPGPTSRSPQDASPPLRPPCAGRMRSPPTSRSCARSTPCCPPTGSSRSTRRSPATPRTTRSTSSIPGSWLMPIGYGCLGTALPMAIGACLAAPDRPVLALAGDGGVLFTLPELAAARDLGLSLPLVVWNNGGYGEIRDAMVATDIAVLGTDASAVDLPRVAEGFGCIGARAESLDHVQDLVATALGGAGADVDRGHAADGGSQPMAERARGAVAAGHPQEVAAALRILAEGGNAVDAAVAGAFSAFVVEPNNAGLAGYGHLTAWLPGEQRFLTVDHGPRAPAAATADLFRLEPAGPSSPLEWPDVVDRASDHGALATGRARSSGRTVCGPRAGRATAARTGRRTGDRAGSGRTRRRLAPLADRPRAPRRHPLAAARPPRTFCATAIRRRLASALDTAALADDAATDRPRGERRLPRRAGRRRRSDATWPRPAASSPPPTSPATRRACVLGAADPLPRTPPVDGRGRRRAPRVRPPLPVRPARARARVGRRAAPARRGLRPRLRRRDELVRRSRRRAGPERGASAAGRMPPRARRAIELDRAAPRPLAPGSPIADDRPAGSGGSRGTTQVAVADGEGGMAVVITTIGQDFGGLVWVPEVGVMLNSAMSNFDPRPGRVNSMAPGRMPLFGVPATIAVRGRARGARLRRLRRLPHPLERRARDRQRARPRAHGRGRGERPAGLVPGRGDVRRCPRRPLRCGTTSAQRGHELVVEELTPGGEPFARVSLVTAGDGTASSTPHRTRRGTAGPGRWTCETARTGARFCNSGW